MAGPAAKLNKYTLRMGAAWRAFHVPLHCFFGVALEMFIFFRTFAVL
jgi:hypothetical protein